MLPELLEAIRAREKEINFGGRSLIVRELTSEIDTTALRDASDVEWKLLVRCVFDTQSGEPVFTDKDIGTLKRGSRLRVRALLDAVAEVNGLDLEAEIKNSDAAPDSASSTD